MINQTENLFFPDGLMGFEEFKSFDVVPIEGGALLHNLLTLQSIDKPDLRFYVYIPLPSPYSFTELSLWSTLYAIPQEDIATMILVTVRQEANNFCFTGNFYAPLLINKQKKQGWQVVLHDSAYSLRQTILTVPIKEHSAKVSGS